MSWARCTCLIVAWFASPLLTCCALAATATPVPEGGNNYFPIARGSTWKYLITEEHDGKADRPYVETRIAGEPIEFKALSLKPVSDDLYLLQGDGVYLYARRVGKDVIPLDEMQKLMPAKLRAGEAWNASTKADGGYCTCMGSRTIKTAAGDFTTQCVYVTAMNGADGTPLKTTYRYFAREVGLVRETITVKKKSSDETPSYTLTRELVAFTPAETTVPVQAKARATPVNCNDFDGVLLDPRGEPMAQAELTLRRADKQEPAVLLQTDLLGRFRAAGLEPTGSYELATSIAGYEPTVTALHSSDGKSAEVTVKLAAATSAAVASESKDDAFQQARKLAADGKHVEALEKYGEALKADPKNASILAYRALSRLALGQKEQADSDVQAAIKLNDHDPAVWEAAGQVKIAENNVAQGKSLFEKAAKISPKTAGAIYTDLAAALSAKNDSRRAGDIESALKSASQADPPSPEAFFQLGQAYANQGKQEGRTYLQKYVELSAKLPEKERDKRKVQVAKQLIKALDVVKSLDR